MKDIQKELKQSNLIKNNKLEVLTTCKCLALGYLNNDMVLIYANGDTLEFHNSSENNLMIVYQDFINQLVNCMPKPTPKVELLSRGEECK